MSKRRALTPVEAEAAHRLLLLWNSRKGSLGLTQEKAAYALGYRTQGAVHQYLHGIIPLGTNAVIRWAKLLGVSPDEIRPDMKDSFEILGPVMAQSDGEFIELSSDEFEWIQMLRQLSPEEQRVMRRAVAALAKSRVDESDCAP